ncbi:MAG: 2'-5' RNA ligase family protein [Chloroflexota bacterium]
MIDVNGVVSLLDKAHADRLQDIWRMLEQHCRLKGKNTGLPPHFTWQVVAQYDFNQFEPRVSALARAASPFTVRTAGLGIFSGPSPILYIQLVKDARLLSMHEQIWQHSQCCAVSLSPYYAPESWVPHITLAAGDVNAENLGCALDLLAFVPFTWEIPVDNLALLSPDSQGGESLELFRIPFEGDCHAS